jgi:glutathionylspermidine synthase
MQRIRTNKRPDWQKRVEEHGFHYHTFDGETYWDESAYYVFSSAEIDEIELATAELNRLYIEAAEHVIDERRFDELRIPPEFVPFVLESWDRDDFTLYGRFDLHYDGSGPPKLFEYNADTPTGLFEASAIQWFWMKDVLPHADQFNSIHEKLIEAWKNAGTGRIHFACARDSLEDRGNLEYLRDTAVQAGCLTEQIFMDEIGWHHGRKRFVDMQESPIDSIFKLYPWEWLLMEDFAVHLPECGWQIIEPAWKLLWSNKAMLPILHELNPGHPNLLPASFRASDFRGRNYVEKPIFAREGANVRIHAGSASTAREGPYGQEGFVFQEFLPLPEFDGRFPVIGSWIVAGEPAGIGVREDATRITGNDGTFVPHIFYGEPV